MYLLLSFNYIMIQSTITDNLATFLVYFRVYLNLHTRALTNQALWGRIIFCLFAHENSKGCYIVIKILVLGHIVL